MVSTAYFDTTISSQNGDIVTLDTSAAVKSLTVGGGSLFSDLTDNGYAQSLTIGYGLHVATTGEVWLTGGTVVTAGADSSNQGSMLLSNGSSLSVSGNFTNSFILETEGAGSMLNVTQLFTNTATEQLRIDAGGSASLGGLDNAGSVYVGAGSALTLNGCVISDVPHGSQYTVYGTFNLGGQSAFRNLSSIEGSVNLNGQFVNIEPIYNITRVRGNFRDESASDVD